MRSGGEFMGRKIQKRSNEHPYHVTARTNNREWFGLDMNEVWEIFEAQLFFIHHAFGVRIHSFVLMNNHFHLIISDPYLKLPSAMRWLMTETSKEIGRRTNRINRIYGQRNYKCLIDSAHYFMHAYKYVYRNPVQAQLSKKAEHYPYSTLHGLLGFSKLVIPVTENILIFEEVEGILNWLNLPVEEKEWSLVGKALKKGRFKLARDKNSKQESRLESDLF